MGDLKDPQLMYLKAFLFLIAGILCVCALYVENPDLRTAFLLYIAIWSFCRLYYFMFYVIEKYIDPGFRFAGIGSFLLYLWRTAARERKSVSEIKKKNLNNRK